MIDTMNKIKISEKATFQLRQLKGITGLTPNIMARIAFCYSLNMISAPDLKEEPPNGMEFNRYTLTGAYDTILMALLLDNLQESNIPIEKGEEYFIAHIERGVYHIKKRIKTITDLKSLVPDFSQE